MTLRPIYAAQAVCSRVNLETQDFGGNLWVYSPSGALLRTFTIHLNERNRSHIDGRDFDNWLVFMGFKSDGMRS